MNLLRLWPRKRLNLALCYESVLPARGGCETYITDFARRLAADGHLVHLYACRWDATALPASVRVCQLPPVTGPRFLRPWRFADACARALAAARHDVSIGFDKTYGQDVLYPQGGLHVASAEHNIRKHAEPWLRGGARLLKQFDPAGWSFARLERRQYLGPDRPLVVVNSRMVQGHFLKHYGIGPERLRVVHSAIDPSRFLADDRPARRLEARSRWGVSPSASVGLFLAMNYRLKGLEPLLRALRHVPAEADFRLVVAGDPRTAAWRRLAERLRVADRVVFAGFCAEARNAYFGADFLVHPTFYDPCSLVVLEALACGLPVITSAYNGASELLDPPHEGLVVDDPHDAAALGGAIATLLDPVRRSAMARAARRAAERWTFEEHYRKFLQVLTEAAARKRAA
jgi:UDP-glucose:(heptosyl)LPS alpha-1,3-glucosyltransferase